MGCATMLSSVPPHLIGSKHVAAALGVLPAAPPPDPAQPWHASAHPEQPASSRSVTAGRQAERKATAERYGVVPAAVVAAYTVVKSTKRTTNGGVSSLIEQVELPEPDTMKALAYNALLTAVLDAGAVRHATNALTHKARSPSLHSPLNPPERRPSDLGNCWAQRGQSGTAQPSQAA